MPENSLVKRVFYELTNLDDMGFKTWVTSVRELASRYNMSLDSELNVNLFKQKCQQALNQKFILDWQFEINDESKHPILKTYKIFKSEFKFEPYLDLVKILNIGSQFQSLEPVRTCLKSNEVDTLDLLPKLKIDAVLSAMLLKMNSAFYWNAPLIKMKGWNHLTKFGIWIHTLVPCTRKINLYT